MPVATLSKADSAAFRKLLAELTAKNKWTLAKVATILGCSRKTAWCHLQPACQVRVRGVYADRLAGSAPTGGVAWSTKNRVRIGTAEIMAAWSKCATAAQRRKLAYRLAVFISECAILLHGIPTTTLLVATDINAEPDSVTVTLLIPRTRICGSVLIAFDRRQRDKLGVSFCDSAGNNFFKGFLHKELLPKLFTKLKSWQKV
jgi:hypothetical protein